MTARDRWAGLPAGFRGVVEHFLECEAASADRASSDYFVAKAEAFRAAAEVLRESARRERRKG